MRYYSMKNMYRHYQAIQKIPSICCDNDNVQVIVLHRMVPILGADKAPEEVMQTYSGWHKLPIEKVDRKQSWVLIEVNKENGKLQPCLWAYENKTQYWMLGDQVIMFEILEEKK